MAWTRVGQLAAENQSLADVATFNGAQATTNPEISNTQARTGSYSYLCANTSLARAFGITVPATTVLRCNFGLQHQTPTNAAAGLPLVTVNVDGAGLHVVWLNDGTLNLRAGYEANTTTVYWPLAAVNAAPLSPIGQWQDIGLVAKFAASGFVSFYVDGAPILTWSGDTRLYRSGQATPRTNILGCYMLGGGGVLAVGSTGNGVWGDGAYADDFYCDTGDGSEADMAPATRLFLPTFPSGAGSNADLTPNTGPNYAAVDEAPPDDETTYNNAGGAGLRDTYAFTAIAVPADYVVRAVIVAPYAKKTDAGTASTLKTVALYDGDETVSAEKNLTTAYGYVWERMETAPDGAAWNEAKVNASEFGVESAGAYA